MDVELPGQVKISSDTHEELRIVVPSKLSPESS